MKILTLFWFLMGLGVIDVSHSRSVDVGECYRKRGISIEQITEPYMLSEGPHWDIDAQVLYFVDIPNQRLYRYDPATGNTTSAYITNGQLGVAIPIADQKNTFIAGAGTDLVQITWDPKEDSSNPKIKVLATVDTDRNGTRFNDGKVDPKGRLWAGTMGINMEPDMGSLYRIEKKDFVPKRIVTPVSISNGLAWSHDNKTMYYIDSPKRQVWAYDYDDPTGDISNKRVLFDFENNKASGTPDGMTIDSAGNLWIACYNGGQVISIDGKTGKLLRNVEMPAKCITSVAFGGPNLDTLYVTSAKHDLTSEDLKSQPLAGSVFAVKGLNISGQPMMRMRM